MYEKEKKIQTETLYLWEHQNSVSLQYVCLFLFLFNGCLVLKLKLWSDGFVLVEILI